MVVGCSRSPSEPDWAGSLVAVGHTAIPVSRTGWCVLQLVTIGKKAHLANHKSDSGSSLIRVTSAVWTALYPYSLH